MPLKAVYVEKIRGVIKAWFELSAKKTEQDRKATQDAAVFISSIVLAVVFGVLPMPTIWKWVGWFFCFWGILYILRAVVEPINRLPIVTTRVGLIFLLLAFIIIFWPLAHSQWREEMATALEGDLIGAGSAVSNEKAHGFPMLQIGETTFVMTPDGVRDIFPFFPDSGVRIEWGEKGRPLFSTTVRDHNGNLTAEIVRNHWRVYPAYSADKNCTENALEILDSAGHVVQQVNILPDRIVLQGEWWDVQGNGIRLKRVTMSGVGSVVVRMNRQNQHLEELIEPMFEYPGKDHWGELKK
jgi:hypothetical protein